MSAALDIDRWVSADVAELKDIRKLVDSLAAEHGLPPRTRYRVKLALHEALTNAIVHGCSTRSQRVHVHIHVDEYGVTFEVADPGRFKNGAVSTERPEHGRGLSLIFGLMDDVDVQAGDEGTTIRAAARL